MSCSKKSRTNWASYDRMDDEVIAFDSTDMRHEVAATHLKFGSDELRALLSEQQYSTLSDDIELLAGAGDE